jgi:hypothetical protein
MLCIRVFLAQEDSPINKSPAPTKAAITVRREPAIRDARSSIPTVDSSPLRMLDSKARAIKITEQKINRMGHPD